MDPLIRKLNFNQFNKDKTKKLRNESILDGVTGMLSNIPSHAPTLTDSFSYLFLACHSCFFF